ncbi:hypothetical protein O9992_11565 [Vibrio lentus]|nr:hypothetical protein [Vibrio lentus]
MLSIPEDSMEPAAEGLRQFKRTCILVLPRTRAATKEGGDHALYLAEAIVERVFIKHETQVSAQFGEPPLT